MSRREIIPQKRKNQNSSRSRRMREAAPTMVPGSSTTSTLGTLLPPSTNVTLKYTDRISIDAAGSGAVALYQFACNGLYDPDITGTGHQPLGFDQLMGTSSTTGFYNHYHVYQSRIKATFCSQAADNTGQAIVAIGISDDTTVGIDLNTMLENPTYKYKILGSVGSGQDRQTIVHNFDAAKQFGLTRSSLFAKDDLKGIYTANPNELAYFSLYVASNNPTVNPAAVSVVVEITFRAHLTERRELLGS